MLICCVLEEQPEIAHGEDLVNGPSQSFLQVRESFRCRSDVMMHVAHDDNEVRVHVQRILAP